MSDDDSAFARANRIRRNRIEAIKNGALPVVDELVVGMPFYKQSAELDFQAWSADVGEDIASDAAFSPLVRDLERAARTFSRVNVQKAFKTAERLQTGSEILERLLFYRCALGDTEARHRLIAIAMAQAVVCADARSVYALSTAIGLAFSMKTPSDALENGEHRRLRIENIRQRIMNAGGIVEIADDEDESVLQAVLDDRAEIDPDADRDDTSIAELVSAIQRAQRKMLIVVPALPSAGETHKGEIFKAWAGIAGTALPLVRRPDLVEARRKLEARGQHTAAAVDTMLRDLAASDVVRFRPTLLIGSPGAGKSALALALATTVGVPSRLISLAGASDSAVGGTSAQWHSAREAPVLQLIRQAKVANPLIVFDEVDKAGTSSHNGNALDAIGIMLERDQAKSFVDPALEVPCDLSMVSFVLTANDISLVPAHVRDRCRIVRVPEPQWRHIAPIVQRIIADIAAERELRPEWFDPLAQDEMQLIKKTWQSGSLRQLRRVVETILDGRDLITGRC